MTRGFHVEPAALDAAARQFRRREGDLRAAADAWERAASALDAAARVGDAPAGAALQGWQGDAATAFRDHWAGVAPEGLVPTADGCRDLAGALRQYADEVESAKHEIEVLAVEIAASLALGAATVWFTFGTSAAAAGVATRLVALARVGRRAGLHLGGRGIVSTPLTGAAFGTVDAAAGDAVGQVFRVEALDAGGYSADELATSAAATGGIGGAWATRALRDPAPDPALLRAPGGASAPPSSPPTGALVRPLVAGSRRRRHRLLPHERRTAGLLADRRRRQRAVPCPERSRRGLQEPGCDCPHRPSRPGHVYRVQEVANSSTSVAKRLREAQRQLADVGGGTVVLDGRAAGLTRESAQDGWERALRNMAHAGPTGVRILLGDGELRLP